MEGSGMCVGIFRETDHALVRSMSTDATGRFDFGSEIQPGEYRLVVSVGGLCPANAKIRVVRSTILAEQLVVDMRLQGIDTCSWIRRSRRPYRGPASQSGEREP